MYATFWWLSSWWTEHIRSVLDMHWVTTGYLFKVAIYTAHISSNGSHFFPAGFLEYWPYKVSKIGHRLFSYALQPAKRTSTTFKGAILEEYLVPKSLFNCLLVKEAWMTSFFLVPFHGITALISLVENFWFCVLLWGYLAVLCWEGLWHSSWACQQDLIRQSWTVLEKCLILLALGIVW